MLVLLLLAGGAAGTLARYWIAGWFYQRTPWGFPWGTIVVNVIGSLLIGFAVRYMDAVPVTPEVRGLVTIGLLGGFTTFSAYTYETAALLRNRQWLAAGAYSFGSLALGLIAVALGLALASFALRLRTV